MTISFRGYTSVAGQASNAITLTAPSGLQAGDFMIAAFVMPYAGGGGPVNTLSGWTPLFSHTTGVPDCWTFYKVATGSEPSSYVWSVSDSDGTATSAAVAAWTGAGALAIDVNSSSMTVGLGTATNTIPAITTTNPGQLLLVSLCKTYIGLAVSTPSGFTKQVDVNPVSSSEIAFFDKANSTVGSTGTVSQHGDQSGNSSGLGNFTLQIYEASVKNVSTTETGSATDSSYATLIANLSTSESGSAIDAQFTGALLTVSESGSATDTPSAIATYGISVAESGSAVDTSDGSKTYSLSISEPIATLAFGPQVGIVYYESNDGVESASASAPSAIFNGSISGTTLTVNSVSSGTVTSGLVLDGPGVLAGTTIQSGGGSTFTVSNSQTIPAQTLYAGVQKHFGFAYSDGTNYVTVRQQGYNISAGNYGGGASGFAQPAYKCLPCAFNATLVGTTLIVSSIGASDPNSINSNPSINIGQQIAVGGVTLTGVTVTSQTSGTTGGVGQYVVTNPNAYNYGSSTAMTSSLQGGLAYAGQYYTPTGVGQPWDSGLFSDAISGTGESSVIIVSQQDGGKFNLNSFRFGPNPHYQTNGNCYIRVTGYTGNIPTFSGSSHPSFNQNGAVLNSDGYANNTTTSMIGVTPSGLTSIASASTAFKGVTSVVFQCYGYAIGNSVGGGPSNSPLFTIDYIITTPNANTGEVSSWSFTANGAVAESGIAADTSNGIGTYTISVAESGNASDSPASNAIFNSTTIEAGAANDLESVGYLATGVVNEVGSAAESIFSTAVFYDLISESGAAADSSSGTGLYVGTTLENGSALDSSSGAGIYGLNTQETGAASETTSPQVSFNAATVETALALDTPIVNVNFNAAVSEFGSAIDSNFPTASYGLGVAETGNASAFTSVLAPIVAAVLENGNAVDNTYQQTITIGPLVASWAASVNFATNLSLVPPANLSTAWTPSATTNFTLTALGSMAANWSTGASSILNASYAADTNDGYDDYTFRQSFPEFADINKYPYATIKMYWSMAGNMVSQASCPCNFLTGDALKLATYYMTAHLMSLALARIAAVNNGSGGTQGGFKTSATIDMITVQYLAPPATQAYEWWLVQTQYGQALWAMIDILSVGGLSIGGLPERAAFRKVGGVFV